MVSRSSPELKSGASRPSLSIRCTGKNGRKTHRLRGRQTTRCVTSGDHFSGDASRVLTHEHRREVAGRRETVTRKTHGGPICQVASFFSFFIFCHFSFFSFFHFLHFFFHFSFFFSFFHFFFFVIFFHFFFIFSFFFFIFSIFSIFSFFHYFFIFSFFLFFPFVFFSFFHFFHFFIFSIFAFFVSRTLVFYTVFSLRDCVFSFLLSVV